jgi:hypothetical protein
MNHLILLVQRARLALQEFGPSMAVLMLPGGYLVALSGWIYQHWPLNRAASPKNRFSPPSMKAR